MLKRLGLGLGLGALLLWPGICAAQTRPETRGALRAAISVQTPEGEPLAAIEPGQPFAVVVETQGAGGTPTPARLPLMGWLRLASPTDLSCAESAAAYRATDQGPSDGIDLNRPVLGVLTEDDVLTVVDPERSLASANILKARRFDSRPADIMADAANGRFLVSLPAEGRIMAQPPVGPLTEAFSGLDQPRTLTPAMGKGIAAKVREGLVLLDASGGQRPLKAARKLASGPDGAGAVLYADRIELHAADGGEGAVIEAPGALDLALSADAVIWLAPDGLHLAWRDAQGQRMAIPIEGGAGRLAVDPAGRFAFVFGGEMRGALLVDLSQGRPAQRIAAHAEVAEIAFADDTAYLRLADQSMTGIIDLRLAGGEDPAPVGQFAMGDPMPASPDDQRLLVPLTPQPALLALHPGNYTAFRLDRTQASSNKPPMAALVLRGGTPRQVAILNRGLVETARGRFRTVTSLPGPGRYELVLSAGIGQASFCAMLPVARPDKPEPRLAQLRAEPEADGYRLVLTDPQGGPGAYRHGRLTLSSLTGNWRDARDFSSDARGRSPVIALPDGGPIIVTLSLADGGEVAPLLLENDR
ncbi:hypothetical protein [uncultured Amaricoccus sp.]|mgnify:CR=1 FL=1|uniref:hypothetical protein n=1 Tax=uncultured Amaricoccus sp. TaxID=339341 RepID=UPI002637ECC3|nr:hypothetical protein [uncultured Amaricoccus sp.]